IPLSFLPGQLGGLFREFGFVLAFAVLLSSVTALTLCPMMASRMLSRQSDHNRGVLGAFGRGFSSFYARTLRACLGNPLIVVVVASLFSGAAYLAFTTIRSELTPREDRSMVMMRLTTPQGSSLAYTRDQLLRVEENLKPLRDSGEIQNIFSISGQGSSNSAFMVMTLAPWSERTRTQDQIVQDVNAAAAKVPALRGNVFQTNSLRIRGAGSGLQMAVVGSSHEILTDAALKIVEAMRDRPEFQTPRLDNEPTQAQISVTIDRERASDLGINIGAIGTSLQALLEGRSVTDVFVDGNSIPVRLVSSTQPINDPTDLENIFLTTSDGRVVPMSSIASLQEKAVSPTLNREQQLAAVSFSAGLADGVALGDAVEAVTEL
ncbi:MAG: efflux RND transporter permease subunit, partial [Allorhizobium sp.]